MITETRQSRVRVIEYERYHPRSRPRRHHTLDNATLDKFDFICVPLRRDESRIDSSSSQTNLSMSQPKHYSSSTTNFRSTTNLSNASRRVRFKCDLKPNTNDFNTNRHTRSFEDVRTPEKHCIHRVEFRIPVQKDVNPWLNVDCSPAKTRAITTQKIDIKHGSNNNNNNHHSIRLQGIAPFVQAEVNPQSVSTNNSDQNQSQWFRQMYSHLHKPPENRQDQQPNPYKPTYTFPDEFNGDSDHMEDYIRKTATHTIEKNNRIIPMSTVRPLTSSLKDQRTASRRTNGHIEKVTRFEDQLSSPITSPPSEQYKSHNDIPASVSSPFNNNFTNNSSSDNEQKFNYKRIQRYDDFSSNNNQQKFTNTREKPTNGTSDQQNWVSRHEIVDSNRSKPTVRLNIHPIYKALALHSFYAQSNRELSFKKGDIILVLRRINDDWLEGEHQGFIGIFPLNHVELFPIEQNDEINHQEKIEEIEGEAIVKYDFIPQKTFELQLRKGDKVILLRRLDDNWYEGRLNHIEGIFPAAYVETLREPPNDAIENVEPIQSIKQPSPPEPEQTETIPEVTLPLQKCQVLYDYSPQNPDELEIHVGDIINIIEMCDDGWYCGIVEKSKYKKSMEFGTFPGNYVKLLPNS